MKQDRDEESMNYILPNQFFKRKMFFEDFNPLSANHTKWLNTFKQFVDCKPTNC